MALSRASEGRGRTAVLADADPIADTPTAPVALPAPVRSRGWRAGLLRRVVVTDAAMVLVTTGLFVAGGVGGQAPFHWPLGRSLLLGVAGCAFVAAAMGSLRCWDVGVIGAGSEEFNRILRAFLSACLLLATAGLLVKVDSVRPWVFGVLPSTGLAVLVGRYANRKWLHHARARARCMSSVLVVGTDESVAELVARTRRVPHHGWGVVAACTPTGSVPPETDDAGPVAVVGDLDDVSRHVAAGGIDVVAVTPTPGWSARRLRQLAWDLEGTGVELVVDPGLMEIGGPRLHVAPVDGLPFLRLTEPRLSGMTRVAKNGFDRLVAAVLLVVFLPVLLFTAIMIRRDGGPAFFVQERVGLGGRAFRMIKFRSMVVDADRARADLADRNEAAGPLFKVRRDPRVTPVGRVIRRYSIDELPQLANVLVGSMSLVGPRPPLLDEVHAYGDDARRRLLVRPGMTGIWQVSGRSDLSWDELLRLDLRYVENWSPALDALILWKTVGAVLGGRGAY